MRVLKHIGTVATCTCMTAFLSSLAVGDVVYSQTNHQYTNVNIDSDQHSMTITGYVNGTTVPVYFNGFDASFTQIELHGQHGVAFIEAQHSTDLLYRLTIEAADGWAFRAMDWKLDGVPPTDGQVTFDARDSMDVSIPLGSQGTFPLDHNGQNPFSLLTSNGTYVHKLIITSTVPIGDLKQLSVDLVPLPNAFAIGSCGLVLTAWRLRRRS